MDQHVVDAVLLCSFSAELARIESTIEGGIAELRTA